MPQLCRCHAPPDLEALQTEAKAAFAAVREGVQLEEAVEAALLAAELGLGLLG